MYDVGDATPAMDVFLQLSDFLSIWQLQGCENVRCGWCNTSNGCIWQFLALYLTPGCTEEPAWQQRQQSKTKI